MYIEKRDGKRAEILGAGGGIPEKVWLSRDGDGRFRASPFVKSGKKLVVERKPTRSVSEGRPGLYDRNPSLTHRVSMSAHLEIRRSPAAILVFNSWGFGKISEISRIQYHVYSITIFHFLRVFVV